MLDPRRFVAVFLVWIFILEIRQGYFKQVIPYFKQFAWQKYLAAFLAAFALAFLMTQADPYLYPLVHDSPNPLLMKMNDMGRILGHNSHFWMVLVLLYFAAYLSRRAALKAWVFGSVMSSALTGVMGQSLKFILLRARPFMDLGPFSFFNLKGWMGNDGFQSMPSGDVSILSGGFLYLAFSVNNLFLRFVLILFPLCSVVYRIKEAKHWPSDTLLSFSIGLIVVCLIKQYERFRSSQKEIPAIV